MIHTRSREDPSLVVIDESEGPVDKNPKRVETRRKGKQRTIAPRRPCTRSSAAKNTRFEKTRRSITRDTRFERIALHQIKPKCVMAWANEYEYALVHVEDYWREYAWEGPREEFRRHNKLERVSRDRHERQWFGRGHGPFFFNKEIYAGL